MRILGLHTEHDASVCLIEDGRLRFSIEAEKDSHPRFSRFTDARLAEVLGRIDGIPDALAIAGWDEVPGTTAGYTGLDGPVESEGRVANLRLPRFSCSHERAHLLSSYGLSPFEQGEPCYALCWEGTIGALYSIDGALTIRRLATPLDRPGHRYAFLFELADPERALDSCGYDADVAGKLMALAAFSSREPLTAEESTLLDEILERFGRDVHTKANLTESPVLQHRCGAPAPEECRRASFGRDLRTLPRRSSGRVPRTTSAAGVWRMRPQR